jgi:hypothetical protein
MPQGIPPAAATAALPVSSLILLLPLYSSRKSVPFLVLAVEWKGTKGRRERKKIFTTNEMNVKKFTTAKSCCHAEQQEDAKRRKSEGKRRGTGT